ncbi:ThiF family adenylyltransferase [Fundidesulfovibrio agrisoli]|uniref:ThiF family adenylyltransferase n=1 Tax=Fundidesulfovibrio agrisoli TaxID=2922717 RepID=UPI001FAD4620|nr:ThiF family adenylyltransferase [Fundidesulfovibrio agrisoli]
MNTDPGRTLDDLAESASMPDGSPVRTISPRAVRSAAHLLGLSLRETEILALEREIIPARYLRNFNSLDCPSQAALLRTRVALVGLGGLGGPLLEGLARLGFGMVRAADHDVFEPSNLNRQLLATGATLGLPKARAAAQRVEDVNPAVELNVRQLFVDEAGFAEFFQDADIALDALGGMASRPAALRGAALAGVPMVTASVAGWTAMAATVLPGCPGPADLFCPGGDTGGLCAEDHLGCLAPAINVAVGLVLAEAVRLALGREPQLGGPHGRMVAVDLGTMSWDRFSLG